MKINFRMNCARSGWEVYCCEQVDGKIVPYKLTVERLGAVPMTIERW